jgi:hypothetical protein
MPNSEIIELRRAIAQLRQCVGALRARYGDAAPVQRLANDVERMDIDSTELADLPVPPQQRSVSPEVVVVPDTPYDPKLWHDADDEGVGGHHRHGH